MATFSRLKVWISGEILTVNSLNAEFDNMVINTSLRGIEDASVNVAAMQATVDPGGVGTESLATTMLGEIQRLRYVIKRAIGGPQWYSTPAWNTGAPLEASEIEDGAITTIKIADEAVTTPKIPDAGVLPADLSQAYSEFRQSSSAECVSFTSITDTWVDVTNLSATIVLRGSLPIEVNLCGTENSTSADPSIVFGNEGNVDVLLRLTDAAVSNIYGTYLIRFKTGPGAVLIPSAGANFTWYIPAGLSAGSHTLKIQSQGTLNTGNTNRTIKRVRMIVKEIDE